MAFDRTSLLDAFDTIGAAALADGSRLELAVCRGSALLLGGNFRFATEDVDIAELAKPWPAWLSEACEDVATRNGWSADWLNEAVSVHLSPLADRMTDHVEFGTFPRGAPAPGLSILVPTADYMLALKLKAIRILDPVKGQIEADDIYSLMKILEIGSAADAIAVLGKYFPNSARDGDKQRFLLKYLAPSDEARRRDAPRYAP